jgi:uncharacterized lipoprotein YajG
MKVLFLTIAFSILSGCAITPAEMKHSERMYDKQIAAIKENKPVPIFQLTAKEGQTIELKGVSQISVYNPSDVSGKIPEYKAQPNVSIEMAKILVPAATSIMGGYFSTVLGIVNATKGAADVDTANNALVSITPVSPFATAP